MNHLSIPASECKPFELSLLAIDIGFDVRDIGIPVKLTHDRLRVTYEHDGQTHTITGDRNQVAEVLRAAGYEVSA